MIPMLLNELQQQQRELAEIVAPRRELAEVPALVWQRQAAQAAE